MPKSRGGAASLERHARHPEVEAGIIPHICHPEVEGGNSFQGEGLFVVFVDFVFGLVMDVGGTWGWVGGALSKKGLQRSITNSTHPSFHS